ncbi:hypothetical protein SCOCK_50134 [Actinacidiphila cocklensis]|jgi:hypothetical protein|uniref:Transposase n=1 Tax=Actinacidiphila cocklensis TaxID=887465 RepID=A0A9W4DW96_9ACTN|nr:hypothetical protein SCOCK_50134 [Actinacidiphila cocklensis]
MAEWQSRPLDGIYPMVFIDAIHVKIRVLSTILRCGRRSARPWWFAIMHCVFS